MATVAVIGRTYTFQAWFLDSLNVPFTPVAPKISIFYHDIDSGDKSFLVSDQDMVPAIPLEAGRYVYNYSISGSTVPGTVLVATMTGVDPSTGLNTVVETEVVAQVVTTVSGGSGMTARLVR